jgi:tetratricopeptide (TPR) repeat protein
MSNPDEARKHLELGDSFFQQGDYTKAIAEYQKVLELDPNFVNAYNGWGRALAKLKRFDEAIQKYQKALELDPNFVNAYYAGATLWPT